MKKLLLFVIFGIAALLSYGQQDITAKKVSVEKDVEEKIVFVAPEEFAAFPGGEIARQTFLQENLQYPALAQEISIQGTVYVSFVVEEDGSLTDIKVLRGIGGDCDEEAIRVIKLMPNWIPGKMKGKSVRCQYTMPIKFILENNVAPQK
jgi:protein TonB